MRRACRRAAGLVMGWLLATAATLAAAQSELQPFTFGYVGLADDPRYSEARLENRFQGEPWGRPIAGAKVAIKESRFPGMAAGVEFGLNEQLVADSQAAIEAVRQLQGNGHRFVLLDLPGPTTAEVADAFAGEEMVLFNVSASDDRLRGQACQANLMHTLPSHAMQNDALAQFLLSRQWSEVLVLVGQEEADRKLADSFARSAKRFGLDIVDEREFLLGNNPRQREQNNPRLLTSGIDYDVVYVADTQGEFARELSYQTQLPRPVVGSGGLVPQAWHWAWQRHGARQLNNRLEELAGRHMTGHDWAAWIAIKAVVEAVQRQKTSQFAPLRDYLVSDDIVLDGFKGYRMGFRDWNGQLRQPILLGSGNWVVARAPFEGFLHQTNALDTLGFDPRESKCKLADN
ncbi:ABC transporter substrate-binding protein [Modicisalibacter luteus]|nr:ABC transporter substrate-binding protein [Halomonas lutea]